MSLDKWVGEDNLEWFIKKYKALETAGIRIKNMRELTHHIIRITRLVDSTPAAREIIRALEGKGEKQLAEIAKVLLTDSSSRQDKDINTL